VKRKNSEYPVEIVCLIDRSGSMATITDDAIDGFNTFLEEQKARPGEANLTLVLFDNEYKKLYDRVPLADVLPLNRMTYQPRSTTALNDAIGKTLSDGELQRKPKVIVAILTDGEENASKEWSADTVKKLIRDVEKWNWQVIYLAASVDAFRTGADLGLQKWQTPQFLSSSQGVRNALKDASVAVSDYRATVR
jgi:predicted metal-dependent peptidase